MLEKRKVTIAEAGIVDIWPEDNEHQNFVYQGLAGESPTDPSFRIPAADTGTEIFFNNQELLNRFATIPLPAQKAFLTKLREALEEHSVEELHLRVRWAGKKTRVIRVINHNNHHLDLFLI